MILHQFWAQGEDKLPQEYIENRERWKACLPAGWEMKLWTDESARAQWPDYAQVSDQCYHHATRCDLTLVRAVRDFGGLAMGTDVIPHNAAKMFKFIDAVDNFVVLNIKGQSCSNGLFFFREPLHEFLCVLARHQLRHPLQVGKANIHHSVGSGCWFHVARRYMFRLTFVTDAVAYTHVRSAMPNRINLKAFVNPTYAGSWH